MDRPNVLLIALPYVVRHIDSTRPKIRSFLATPYGLLSIATYCRDLANIQIIDCDTLPDHRKAIQEALENFRPDIVGFSMNYDNSYPHLEELAGMVKDYDPNILVVLGGSAASYSYEEIIHEQEDVDAICFGEGELPFAELLKGYSTGHARWINNLRTVGSAWVLRDTISGSPPLPSYIQDLDQVIDTDYSFVDPKAYEMQEAFSPYARSNRKSFFLMTSRGCPFGCRFCSNSALHGKKVRQASVGSIVAHVRRLVEEYGMETLIIYDDCLLYHKTRAKEIFRRLAQFSIRIEMPNGVNVAFVDEEIAELMAKAGVDTVYLAIESGSEYVLKELIHKPLKLRMVKPAVEALQKHGLFCHAFIVLGMPGETDEHRRETERFLLDVGVNWAGINLATPVRGSQLYADCIKNGWIQKQKISDIVDKKYVINYPGQDPGEVERQAYEMNLNINFHHNQDMRNGNYERAAACFRQVMQRYGGHELAKKYLAICEGKTRDNG